MPSRVVFPSQNGNQSYENQFWYKLTWFYNANKCSHSTAFVQSKDCNESLITAIDSALSLTVIHYSQTTANVQLMTALIAKSDNN